MYEIFGAVDGGSTANNIDLQYYKDIYYDFIKILHGINKNTMILHEGLLGIPRD